MDDNKYYTVPVINKVPSPPHLYLPPILRDADYKDNPRYYNSIHIIIPNTANSNTKINDYYAKRIVKIMKNVPLRDNNKIIDICNFKSNNSIPADFLNMVLEDGDYICYKKNDISYTLKVHSGKRITIYDDYNYPKKGKSTSIINDYHAGNIINILHNGISLF